MNKNIRKLHYPHGARVVGFLIIRNNVILHDSTNVYQFSATPYFYSFSKTQTVIKNTTEM